MKCIIYLAQTEHRPIIRCGNLEPAHHTSKATNGLHIDRLDMSIILQTHKYIMQKTYKLSYITLYVIGLIIRVDMYWNGSVLHAACSCMAPGHACYRMTDVGRMLLNWGSRSVTVAKSEFPELCQFSFTKTTYISTSVAMQSSTEISQRLGHICLCSIFISLNQGTNHD